jgi:porphobilinogen synthase
MPEIQRMPLSSLVSTAEEIRRTGIKAVILFGVPSSKERNAQSAYDERGVVQQSVELLRKHFSETLVIITDVCLCQYTTDGHCGILLNKKIDNDKSARILAKVALSHARAGADIVAPSAMMDGQVAAIRTSLDRNGFGDVAIMGYSAKQASQMYAPFRDASHSKPKFGDRKTYQMPYTNSREALREIQEDISEGVDIVMIKPALPNLDLIYQARKHTNLPVCAYSVSGEYALVKAASQEGWLDEKSIITELLTSIKRAGADMMITYHAMKMAQILNTAE